MGVAGGALFQIFRQTLQQSPPNSSEDARGIFCCYGTLVDFKILSCPHHERCPLRVEVEEILMLHSRIANSALIICRSLGCLEAGCPLCAQNPNRRCRGCFSGKYLAGDVLKAKCGSSIHVDIVSRASLEPAPLSVMENTILEVPPTPFLLLHIDAYSSPACTPPPPDYRISTPDVTKPSGH